MAVAVGSITQASRTTGATNLSFTISHDATGASALLVFYGIEGNRTFDPATATYGGAAMTLLRRYTQANGGTFWLYGLTSPASGTNNVVLTDSSGSNYYDPGVAFVVNLSGTSASNAFGTVSAGAGTTTSASTSLATTAANSRVVDFAMSVFHPAPTLASSSPSATVNATHSTYGNLQAKVASRAVPTSGTTATASWTTAYNYVDAVAVEVLEGISHFDLTASPTTAGTPSLASPAASTPPPAGFTTGQRLDTSGATAGYELWGKHDGTNFVFALRAPVPVTTFTTLWLNTDANSSTGHLVFGWAVGAEYNINFYTDGLPYLYSGDAGQTYLGGPLGATFNSDHTEAIVTLPSSSIASPAALEVFTDVNNSVFIPSSYSLYTYTVTAVTLYSLTASGLDAGAPEAGTPALTQDHVLTASALAPSAPVLDTPALTQAQVLEASALDAGAPDLASAALTQAHDLAATDLTTSAPPYAASTNMTAAFPDVSLAATGLDAEAPDLGATGLTQVHELAPDTFSGTAPDLGTPAASRIFPDISLAAVSPATSAPVLDSPSVTREFPDVSLAATSLATSGGPLLGSSYLTQRHVLTADAPGASAAVLASPDLAQDFVLSATAPATSAPVLASPALTQDHVLAEVPPANSAPVLGSPGLTQRHVLTATVPATDTPTLGSPSVSVVVPDIGFTPDELASSAPALGTPSLSHGYVLTVVPPDTSAPVLAEGTLTQRHALAATPPATSAPDLGTSAVSQAQSLVLVPPVTSAPDVPSSSFSQAHQLIAASLVAGAVILGSPALTPGGSMAATPPDLSAPDLGSPAIGQDHVLAPAGVTGQAPLPDLAELAQGFMLGTPSGLAAGTPDLGTSGLTQAQVIGTTDFSGSVPTLGTTGLVQDFALAPDGTASSAPVTLSVTLSQVHVLAASSLTLSAPDVGEGGVVQQGLLTPSGVLTATPSLGPVTVTQVHVLTATATAGTAPVISQASLTQSHVLGAPDGLDGSAPELGTPAASAAAVNVPLIFRDLTTGNAYPDTVALVQEHFLAPASLTTPAPILGTTDDPANFEDPLGLGEFMIVSLTEAKRHLRIDTDLEDDDVTLKLQAAETEVLDYLNRPGPWVDSNNVEVPAPAPVRAATLMVLGDLHLNREEGIVGSIHSINPTARRLLARYRYFD